MHHRTRIAIDAALNAVIVLTSNVVGIATLILFIKVVWGDNTKLNDAIILFLLGNKIITEFLKEFRTNRYLRPKDEGERENKTPPSHLPSSRRRPF